GTPVSVSGVAINCTSVFRIGGYSVSVIPFTGYISDFRVSRTALYTTSFSVPAAPLTAVQNTSLLTLQNSQPHNNHTFRDSSTYNHLITRVGNTSQGTFSPFSPAGWGNYFNGSSYLTVPDDLALDLDTGNFTIEAWIYPTSVSPAINYTILAKGSSSATGTWQFDITSSSKLRFQYDSAGAITSTASLVANTWTHVAVVREGTGSNQTKLYINGGNDGTGSVSSNFGDATTVKIGLNRDGTTNYVGYISNARVVKGVAVYTGNFTVPTSALTAIPGTSLLTCQTNRFVDNSSNNFAITPSGSPSVQAWSPFAATATYSPAIHGGSAYFDGTADYLSTAQNPLFNFGTTAFTVECWVYFNAFNSGDRPIGLGDGANGGSPVTYTGWSLTMPSSGTAVSWYRYDGTETNLSASYSFSKNTWYHIAVCRNGSNNLSIFVNGSRVYNNTSVSVSFNNVNSNSLYIGAVFDGSGGGASWKYLNGYVSNARIVNGAAIYDPTQTTITVPTAPLTATSTTSLLLNFTNDAIEDATGRNVIETVADARTTSVISKWAGSHSMYFDGSDYLQFPTSNPLFYLGSGNWTIEGWFYATTVPAGYTYLISVWGVVGQADTTYSQFVF
ncbi:MAG: LamG domain-containing protein, partial [Proteobacteria bacterium]|nr:LamG domain-containing protein [Pseudomonadota bacterium]